MQGLGGRRIVPVRLFYYDALDDNGPEPERAAFAAYLDAVEQLADTSVATGYVKSSRRRGREQKAVDVQLAVDALEAALTGRADVIALVAGDGDFAPLAEAVRRAGPHCIVLAFPNSLARELRMAADRVVDLPDTPKIKALVPDSVTP